MGTKFSDFMREVEAQAQAEGPDAVAEMVALQAHYRAKLAALKDTSRENERRALGRTAERRAGDKS